VVNVDAARVIPVRLRFTRPVRTARGDFDGRTSLILELSEGDDLKGYGEAAPWPGFGTESEDEARTALEHAARLPHALTLEPGDWPDDLAARLRAAPAARAAVQGAVWDLAARRAGRPLADQLASQFRPVCGKVLREVPASALLRALEPDALREEAAQARAAGYRAAKIKLGAATPRDDLARARAAREGLGPDAALRGDANGAWNMREAIAALELLAQVSLDYVEQPLAADDIAGLARLRGSSPVRIAADESLATQEGALRLIEAAAVDVFVLKPAMLGGPAAALAIASRARQAGIEVVFSHSFESAVGARHVLHCAAAWGDPGSVHALETTGLFLDDVANPAACRGGLVALQGAPGLGITL
jgi:L-Ala-D/L-Glu epimerase